MSPIAWWAIPAVATLVAILWVRWGGRGSGPTRSRPEPGSAADLAELAQMESAMSQPLPNPQARGDNSGAGSSRA